MKPLLILILTSEKYLNSKERQQAILNTWGKNCDIHFYAEYEDKNNKIIKVCDVDDVEEKIKGIFEYINKNLINEYEWFYFCDDDCFVNTKFLLKILQNFDPQSVHGMDCFGCYGDLHYPQGGAGFLVHQNLIPLYKDFKNFKTTHSDVTFGLNTREKGIKFTHNDIFKCHPPSYYNIPEDKIADYVSFHYIKDETLMSKLNDICINI
jgi:hypothetical protein